MPFDRKGKRAEEAIALMKVLWSAAPAEFRGRFFSIGGVRAEPRPIQKPHPPVIFGGKSSYAYSRTARIGDGWFGFGLDLDAAANCIGGHSPALHHPCRPLNHIRIHLTSH